MICRFVALGSLVLACFAPAGAAAEGEGATAPAAPRSGVRQPLSGDPGWLAQVSAGGGVVMLNSAGGQHHVTPELTMSAGYRSSALLTLRTRLDLATRREGTKGFFAETNHAWLSFRPEATLGTDRVQFLAGMGPSVIFTTTHLQGAGRNVYGNSIRPGFEYGVGLRWTLGRYPMGLDIGGHQRETRHDFRTTFTFGWPVLASRSAAAEAPAPVPAPVPAPAPTKEDAP